MKIGLISCSAKKNDEGTAEYVYSASTFNSYCVKYCQQNYDYYYFISAKYGLIKKDMIIKRYDLTLNDMRKKEVLEWSFNLKDQINSIFDEGDELYVLAGKLYYQYWINNVPFKVKNVLGRFKGIGYMTQWLKEETKDKNDLMEYF